MKKAVFFDRDGVINVDHGYVFEVCDFEFMDGIFSVMRSVQKRGYALIIVTNQSGIGRGYYSEADFQTLTEWMVEQFKEEGIHIDGVYYCPHCPESNCSCRKPEPGMFLQAIREHHLDVARSWMVGDKPSDMLAAKRVGIKNRVFMGAKLTECGVFSIPVIDELLGLLDQGEDKGRSQCGIVKTKF